MCDNWPRPGETIDLGPLDWDRTAAVEEIITDDVVDAAGVHHRRTRLKLRDKKDARLHDDDGLAAQGRGLLLLARRKKRIEIEEQPLDGRLGIVPLLFYSSTAVNFVSGTGHTANSAGIQWVRLATRHS